MTSKIESENRYIVRVPHGEALYIASEASSQTQRCLCGSGRSFVMHLHDNTRQEAMVLKRRLAAASCCFPCRLQVKKITFIPFCISNSRLRIVWLGHRIFKILFTLFLATTLFSVFFQIQIQIYSKIRPS